MTDFEEFKEFYTKAGVGFQISERISRNHERYTLMELFLNNPDEEDIEVSAVVRFDSGTGKLLSFHAGGDHD